VKRVLVTGGAGFIGSALVRDLLTQPDIQVTVLDKLTYAGNPDNLKPIAKNPCFRFVKGDICNRDLARQLIGQADQVINLAAETHIDRSIADLDPFVHTDFQGTAVLLSEFQKNPRERFIQISTSEVYGSAQHIPMNEDHPLNPQSPYAATKLGAERLAYSYVRTYDLPIVIIRPFNNYGPYQYPEKLIPFFITSAIEEKPLLVYGNGENTRDWVFVHDCSQALQRALDVNIDRIKGQAINIGTGEEFSVMDIAHNVLSFLGKSKALIRMIPDRPGHVRRLISSTNKARTLLNWQAAKPFSAGIKETLLWYDENRTWWQKIRRKRQYQDWYHKWYERQLNGKNHRRTRPEGTADEHR
jgi:dTDP-glucose 4,6-dehydratase